MLRWAHTVDRTILQTILNSKKGIKPFLTLREDAVAKLEWPFGHTNTSVSTATGTPHSAYSRKACSARWQSNSWESNSVNTEIFSKDSCHNFCPAVGIHCSSRRGTTISPPPHQGWFCDLLCLIDCDRVTLCQFWALFLRGLTHSSFSFRNQFPCEKLCYPESAMLWGSPSCLHGDTWRDTETQVRRESPPRPSSPA